MPYNETYAEYIKLRKQLNAKMKTVSKTSQGYKSFKSGLKDVFGKGTRITKYMPDVYVGKFSEETLLKANDLMHKTLGYNSITRQEQYEIDIKKRAKYESDIRVGEDGKEYQAKELTYDELMEWIKDSEHFSDFINAFDSDQAIGYAHALYESVKNYPQEQEWARDYFDKTWEDVAKFVRSEQGEEYFDSLKKSERDEKIANAVANTLERLKAQFKQ